MDRTPPSQPDLPVRDAAKPAPPAWSTLADPVERQLRMLERLAELGMELAETIQHQAVTAAKTDPTGPTAADLAVKFTRVARSVGQIAALSSRIRTEDKAASRPHSDYDRRRRAAARAEEYRRKDKIRATVERAVRAFAPPAEVEERLMQLDDRLEDPALQPDLDIGRLTEIVIKLCDEFKVQANFRDWTDAECDIVVQGGHTAPPAAAEVSAFDPPPGPTLTEIVMAEAAARQAEAPDAGTIDPTPD